LNGETMTNQAANSGGSATVADSTPCAATCPALGGNVPALVDRTVIHDLRNPLSAIGGNLQLLQASLEATIDAKNKGRLESCLASVEELTGMMSDLHYLVLAQQNALEMSPKKVDLRATTRAALQSIVARVAKEGRSITLTEGPSPCLSVAAQLVARAVQNLVVSALRACKTPPITIDIAEAPARLIVGYQGIGVPAELAEGMFELAGPQQQHPHGLRLDRARGLLFVHLVAQRHHGKAWYEPRPDGGRFVLELADL
jgi:K+-sensing histidine kinase KdpD